MQLDQLVFSVDSTQLDEARIKIAKLGDAVGSLNKPMQEVARSSAKTNEIIAKSELAAEKARAATKSLGDQVEDSGDQMSRTEAYINKLVTGLKIFRGETITVQDSALKLGDSFTKGQANALAYQMQIGATTDQLKVIAKQFQDINAFSNTNPFDKSTRGLSSLRQEIAELQMVDKFMRDGVALTREQIINLAKDSERLTQAYNSMGKSQQELTAELIRLKTETIDAAKQKNILTEAARQSEIQAKKEADALIEQSRAIKLVNDAMMKEWANSKDTKPPVLVDMAEFYKKQEIAARQLTAAEDDLILREQKLAFVNKELAAGLSTASANALFKYQKDLEAIGKSADEVSQRMTSFRAGLVERQSHSPMAKLTQDVENTSKRLDHLSRALGPQITDIFVGLATGQSLLTVALQQGGQIRDQIALSGVASVDMGKALSTAAVQMVGSLKDVSVAMGTLLITPFIAGGKAVTDFATKILFANKTIQAHSLAVAMYADNGNKLASFLVGAFSRIPMLIGASAASMTIFAGISLAAFFAVEKQMKALTTSLILTGGSLGLTTDTAVRMAQSMEQVGVSSSKALDVMTVMAKQGGFASREIELVTKSAVDMQKWLGVSVEDTVKQFSKLKGEPVDALIEIAKQTGLVDSATLATVISLAEQGRTAEAAAVAMKAYGDVTVAQVQRAKQEYTEFAQLMIGIGEGLGKFWDNIKSLWIKAAPSVQLTDQINNINRTINDPLLSKERKTSLEAERNELVKQYLLLEKKILNEEQSLLLNTESAKVIENARKTTEKYLTGIPKLEAERTAEKNKQVRLEEQLNNKLISQVAYEKGMAATKIAIAKIDDDIAKENKKNNAESVSAAKKYQDELKKAINVYEDIVGISGGVTKSYNEQVDALKMLGKEGKKSPEQIAEAFGKLEEQQPRFKALVKDFEDYDKAMQAHLGVMKEYKDLNSESSAQLEFRASLLGKTAEEQRLLTIENEKSVALLKAQVKYEKDLKALTDSGLGGLDLETAKINLTKEYETQRTLIAKDANLKIVEDYQKQFEAIQKELGDVMFLALTNRGAQAGKKLRDLIKAELMKPITLVINAVIGEVFGGAIASLLSAVGIKAPAGFNLGTVGSIAKGVSAARDIYATATSGFAPVGVGVSASFNKFAVSSFGEKLGLSQQVQVPVTDISATGGAPVTETVSSTQMTELGNSMSVSLGQIATSTASLVAGAAMRKMFSGGYSMGNGMETAQGIAMAAAEFFFPGIGGAVAGAVSGLMNRAFGHKLKEVGIVGTFGGDQGFVGQQYKYEKGGWFSDDKTSFSALEQKTTNSLTTSFRAIQIAVGTLATSLGVSTDSIEKFTYDMKLNLKGLSDLDIQKQITAEFTNMQEQMSQGVLQSWAKTKIDPKIQQEIDDATTRLVSSSSWWGKRSINKEITTLKNKLTEQADDVWKSLLRAVDDKGTMETAVQLLERLSNTLATVNGSLDTLGYSLLQLSIDSAILATNLTDAFGGVDEFSKSMSYFYNNFYTEQEKTTTLTRQLTTAFAKLGYELPKTTYEFRDLMQAAIEGGDYGLAASLGKLQTSFIELAGPVGQLEEKFKQLSSGLLEEVNRLRGAVISDVSLSGGIPGLTAEFAMLTAQAKSGNTAALEKLPEYSQAIEQAVAASAVNASDVAYARAWLAESLGNTNAVLTGTSPSIVSSSLTQDVAGTTTVNGATAIVASSSSQSDLIAALVAEVQGLRAEVRADVSANSKTAKILERANQDGETLSVSVV